MTKAGSEEGLAPVLSEGSKLMRSANIGSTLNEHADDVVGSIPRAQHQVGAGQAGPPI